MISWSGTMVKLGGLCLEKDDKRFHKLNNQEIILL